MYYKLIKRQYRGKMCFVCGTENEFGLNTDFYVLEHERILGICKGLEIHQSYPHRMHGGIITALLDEALGRTIQLNDIHTWGVTYELKMRFLKPVPLQKTLYVVGWLTRDTRRIFEGAGYVMTSEREILATCTAKYLKQKAEEITKNQVKDGEWELNNHPFDLEGIELPE